MTITCRYHIICKHILLELCYEEWHFHWSLNILIKSEIRRSFGNYLDLLNRLVYEMKLRTHNPMPIKSWFCNLTGFFATEQLLSEDLQLCIYLSMGSGHFITSSFHVFNWSDKEVATSKPSLSCVCIYLVSLFYSLSESAFSLDCRFTFFSFILWNVWIKAAAMVVVLDVEEQLPLGAKVPMDDHTYLKVLSHSVGSFVSRHLYLKRYRSREYGT